MTTALALPFIAADLDTAARASGLSVATLRAAINDGSLTVHYAGPRKTKPVVRAADLDEWLQSLPTEPPERKAS